MNDRLRLTGTSAPAATPTIPAAALRVRGRIAQAMLAEHAISPEDAIEFVPGPADAEAFARLRAAGVVREVPGGRFWFDLVAYHLRERARGRTITIWAFALAVFAAVAIMLLY